MKVTQLNSAALFMALALTAAPALAGTSHGGSPLASTDEHAALKVGESPTADSGNKTAEVPLTSQVNIQPGVRAGDTVKADADANAKLKASGTVQDQKVEDTTKAKAVINPEAPVSNQVIAK